VFISSPADVLPERNIAERVIARLDREFVYHFHVQAVRWEREPLTADHHFQDIDNIPPPRSTDIVVVVLWSQLGVPLPCADFRGAISGEPVTGTEWEFEDALAAARASGRPHLLLYRKTEPAPLSDSNLAEAERKLGQARLVESFMGRWFRDAEGGSFTAASHIFRDTAEFEEKLYDHLHSLLERRLLATAAGAAAGGAIRWHGRPFRGLEAFDVDDAPIFFGRTRARHELRERLARQIDRGCAFVLVLGASGSGKSSLIKAGLLPDLMLPGMIGHVAVVRRAVLRPADRPGNLFAALAAALLAPPALPELAALRYTPDRLAGLLRQASGEAALPIEQGLDQVKKTARLTEIAEARLVLLMDQLEELFTLPRLAAEERDAFVAALAALARSGLVWVVATMRSDFFDRIETVPALARLADSEARFLLAPPSDAEIGQIVRLPAREAGLRFEFDAEEGLDLADAIRAAAARNRGALPLLSYVLDQLWQRKTREGVLTFAAYRGLGGLEGALGGRAEQILAAQTEAVQAAFPRVLRALVEIGHDRAAAARAAPLGLFPPGSAERDLVDCFVAPDARLLVIGGEPGGEALVRIAHEALLTHWPRAAQQIEADRADLQLRTRLEQDAARWESAAPADRESLLLHPGLPLTQAADLIARRGAELAGKVASFIAASLEAEERRRAEEAVRRAAERDRAARESALRAAYARRRRVIYLMILTLIAAAILFLSRH